MLGTLIDRPVWLLVAALAAAVGFQTVRLADAQAATQRVLRERAELYATMERNSVDAHERYRQQEATLQQKVDEATHELTKSRAASARAVAAVRADADRLRNQLAAYAAGSGGTAPDSLAACIDRADRLGRGLAEVLRDYAAATADAEAAAADTRALLAAWPR